MITYVVVGLLIIAYISFRWKYRNIIELRKQLNTEKIQLPILRHSFMFLGDEKAVMNGITILGEESIKNNGLSSGWLAHNFFVVIADPCLAEFLSKTCLEKHDIMKKCMKDALGYGIFIAPVPVWRQRRRIMTSSFTPKNLNQYMEVILEQCHVLAKNLRPTVGDTVFLFEHFVKCSMEIMFQIATNSSHGFQNTNEPPFVMQFQTLTHTIGTRFFQPWLHFDTIFKLVHLIQGNNKYTKNKNSFRNGMEKMISKERKIITEKEVKNDADVKSKSILEQLIKASGGDKGYGDLELREEVTSVIVAGTDTTASTTAFCCLMLARFPEVQEKVYEELKGVFEDQFPDINGQTFTRLKYLDAVIKETLRLYPAVPVIVRKTEKDVTLPTGVVLPKDCGILIHIQAINRNKKYWGDDADSFRPERFLDIKYKHPAQNISFSYGPRNCIGAQFAMITIKSMLTTLVWQYRLLPGSRLSGRPEDIQTGYSVTVKDVENFPVVFQLRE